MADDTTQRAAFAFLREHLQTQEPFTLDEFIATTGWEKPGTFNTYLRKQYKGLIEKVVIEDADARRIDLDRRQYDALAPGLDEAFLVDGEATLRKTSQSRRRARDIQASTASRLKSGTKLEHKARWTPVSR